jgi:hypothetical protein
MIRLGRRGDVTEVRVARTVRIDPASVEAYIRRRRAAAARHPGAQQEAA